MDEKTDKKNLKTNTISSLDGEIYVADAVVCVFAVLTHSIVWQRLFSVETCSKYKTSKTLRNTPLISSSSNKT